MALFRRNFNQPGPGVPKDEPRKKGLRRFTEVFVRDFANLVKLNLFFFACALPSAGLFLAGLLLGGGGFSLLFFVLALVAAFPIGGAVTAAYFCISKMLRDDPGFIGHDFKRKFKENARATMPMGIFCTAVVYIQIYFFLFLIGGTLTFSLPSLVFYLLSLLLFGLIMPYFFLQAGYLELKAAALLKNSLLLALANAPRSFMGALLGALVWAVFAVLFPSSLLLFPLLPVLAFTLSWLLTLMWIWPPVNKQFNIEETLRNMPSPEDADKD